MKTIDTLQEIYMLRRIGRSSTTKDPNSVYTQVDDFSEKNEKGQNYLHIAVENLDMSALLFFLEKGVLIEPDNYNNTLLHTLAKSPYMGKYETIIEKETVIYDIAKLLINNNVKPKRKNDNDRTAYVMAAEWLAYPILKAIAEAGVKMDASMGNGMNLMHYILEKSGYNKITEIQEKCLKKTIEALIKSGLDPEDEDAFGKTPDYYAQRANALTVLALLLGKEDAAPENLLSLKEALDKNQYGIADKILENGANINEVDEKNLMTPLMWFCFIVDYKAVKYLISKGADVDYKEGTTGKTAFSIFINNGYQNLRGNYITILTTIFKDLCDVTNNINNIIDDNGNTILNLLCKQRNMEGVNTKLVEILIDKGVDLNIPDLEGLTPMMSFARYNGEELKLNIIELLIDEGADVTAKDRNSNTLLSYAAMNNRDNDAKKIAELVLAKDRSIAGYANINGKTAMDIAIESSNEACAKAILMNM